MVESETRDRTWQLLPGKRMDCGVLPNGINQEGLGSAAEGLELTRAEVVWMLGGS